MTQYIDKDALVAEIEKWISGWTKRLNNTNPSNPSFFEGGIEMGKHILTFIDSLEVKEVDLEKEWKEFLKDGDVGFKEIAKHFFELGLKAQKGE